MMKSLPSCPSSRALGLLPKSLPVLGRAHGFKFLNRGDKKGERNYSIPEKKIISIYYKAKWRRGRDSNPRDSYPPTPLAGARLQPLGHLSADLFKDHGMLNQWLFCHGNDISTYASKRVQLNCRISAYQLLLHFLKTDQSFEGSVIWEQSQIAPLLS